MKRQLLRMKLKSITPPCTASRRGSTLVIVIALLGLLATTGTVFYMFASQQRAAAEFFSEAAKDTATDVEDPFPPALEQILIGPRLNQKGSIFWSPTRRHSIVRNMVGNDVTPYSGSGFNVTYDAGLPVIDNDFDDAGDVASTSTGLNNRLNLLDSPAAWGGPTFGLGPQVESAINQDRTAAALPEPDVDYTYPDINSPFLAFKGFAFRDNGVGTTPRFERIAMLIPSYFRPQYLKSASNQKFGTIDVPTDPDWFDETVPAHAAFAARSFRPHPQHVAGFDASGTPVLRYLDGSNGSHSAAIAALPNSSGPFPLRRSEGTTRFNNSANFGKLGIWTGDGAVSSTTFELDSDNDGDGIREGIWLDTNYPIQETAAGDKYAILHSFTIYDLDGLIDLNAAGNVNALARDETDVRTLAGGANLLATTSLHQSNQGLGPHEINPLFALAPRTNTLASGTAFTNWYGANPSTRLEQANMQWLWLLTGRIDESGVTPVVHDGRLGDASLLWYHRFTAGRSVATLPRPGRSGKAGMTTTDDLQNFGGFQGFDDNLDLLEGISHASTGRVWAMVHPIDISGRGRRTFPGDISNPDSDPRRPNLYQDAATPEQWLRYIDYPMTGSVGGYYNNPFYLAGRDANLTTDADNLYGFTSFGPGLSYNNPMFEDPYETIMDHDRALRPDDQLFNVQDLISAHLTKTDADNAKGLSDRLKQLAPDAFGDNSDRSNMFTTYSNSFRHFALQHDTTNRRWEWSADVDQDGNFEFPPQFGTVTPFSANDPFRPPVRRLLFTEAGEQKQLLGQLPLSLNHILDVDRSNQNPIEGTPEYLNVMQRSGLRFRNLIEHPAGSETNGGSSARESVTTIPTAVFGTALPPFPPQTFADREFWARRDRQKLARDIYVLLYTIGGAEFGGGQVIDYTQSNSVNTAQVRAVYSEEKVRQMAQFAVNLVDAMDSDNIITKFEFDKNLGDGWGLDDDAYTFTFDPNTDQASGVNHPVPMAPTLPINLTANGMYPDDRGDRGVVYGVESQQIVFSEVLGIRSTNLTADSTDHPATPFDDTNGGVATKENDFVFAELQNVQPSAVNLGSQLATGETIDKTVWRLVRRDRLGTSAPIQDARESSVIPTHFVAFATDTAGNNVIPGGGRFSISATNASGPNVVSSDFFVDFGEYDSGANTYIDGPLMGGFDGTYELIAPNATTGTLPTTSTPTTDPAWAPRCDVDLVAHNALGVFYQSATQLLDSVVTYQGHDANGPFGASVAGDFASTTDPGFDLVLERRLNPELPSISDLTQNPWIEVDRIRVTMTNFNIAAADTAGDLRAPAGNDRLENIRSSERGESLTDNRQLHTLTGNTTAFAFRSNSIKGDVTVPSNKTLGVNEQSPTRFTLWQPHWDREFVSPGELLTLPVYPPSLLTQKLAFSKQGPFQQVGTTAPFDASGAAAVFLRPDLTPETPDIATANDNRWYRLFQFVEVPSRVNRTLGNYINLKRLPGKLNPNTIRDREVYAGLIDDPELLAQGILTDSNSNGEDDGPFSVSFADDGDDGIVPVVTGGIRDRWLEFVNERDGYVKSQFDPTPGLPNSGDESAPFHWIPGAANSRPFRSFGYHKDSTTPQNDDGLEETLLRRLGVDVPAVPANAAKRVTGEGGAHFNTTSDPESNRHWLEVGNQAFHKTNAGAPSATPTEHHQLLSKILNNTTTTSNTFIIFGTAAYFAAHEDSATGLFQIGGRMGLDLDGDADHTNDAGWEQRAVFVVDRTEFYNAYDSATGNVDWKRLIKYRIDLTSDGK